MPSLTRTHLPLSGFYFFWFATLGAVLPYWGLYLRDLGFSEFQIGMLFAVMMGAKMIAPVIWGWLADRFGIRLLIIRGAAGMSLLAFVGMAQAQQFMPMLGATIVYAFFWNAALPQFEAVTLNHLADREHDYGRIRLWGSVGFIFSVLSLGPLLALGGQQMLIGWLYAALGGIFLVSLAVDGRSEREVAAPAVTAGLLVVLRQPAVFGLLIVCFLAQLSHGPYYTFFSIYLTDAGYESKWIGALWAVGVVAEIGVFIALPQLMARFSARKLMTLALLVTMLRWWLLAGFVDSLAMLLLIQLMHLATFGIYHAVAVTLIHRLFQGRLQGRGQALYSAVSFGAGGALGSLLSGWLWEVWPPAMVYAASGCVALIAGLIAWRWLPRG